MFDSIANKRAKNLGKGFNLNNWLDAFWQQDYPKEKVYLFNDLEIMKSFGMNTVRLPVLFEWLAEMEPPYSLKLQSRVYSIIDEVIKWCSELKMNLILCNHHGPILTNDNYKLHIQRLSALWKHLTEKYINLPKENVFFEIKNEPNNLITNENLFIVQSAIISAIREIDFGENSRTIILGANNWNAAWSLAESNIYPDENLIYTFHSYSPYQFTHQGLSWTNLETGLVFPINKNEINIIRQDFYKVKNWSIKNNVPIFLGEYGVGTGADELSRCVWIEEFSKLIKEIDIPWAYWDIKHIKDSFGIFTEEEINPELIIPISQSEGENILKL